ncbi:Ger(x)C family spore germination protein [Bacillus vallismortis]|uniref:Ger(x)C family spore germination protein n=1 Tax=Bacillus vallismortis TaxID=72361 RepID=UPI00227F7EEA|nr:Ger(x)C family spore germination protein [Bacillus vallismortis]MCY8309365.1 Ger(x)C family spore germination protein [Bacillus vallismortis]MCY8596962.1 Ger(x)C family spore germination protein [Bacillus vallismortis]
MKIRILSMFMCVLLLSGCWDSRNIEELSLVIGVGLDKPDDENLELTQQILVPKKISTQEGSPPDPTQLSVTKGETVHQMTRTSALKHNPTFPQHLRVILFSKDVISDNIGMDALINQFVRDNGTRRSSYVFVTDGRTKDIFKMSDGGEPASNVIYDLTGNNNVTIKMMNPVTLGEVSEHLTSDDSFLIPHVGEENGKLAINGASIIKNKFWVRNLTPGEVQNINLFTGTVEGGVIDLKHKGNFFSYEVYSSNRKIKTIYKNGKFKFIVTRNIEGRLSEDWNPNEDSFKDSYIKEIEKAVVKRLNQTVTSFITGKLQKEIKADVTGLGNEVRIHYPQKWKEISSKWDDEYFSNAEIDYRVNVIIRDFGTKGATK